MPSATVHWDLRMEGKADEVIEKLKRIRQKLKAACAKLPEPFRSKIVISPVQFWDYERMQEEKNLYEAEMPSVNRWFFSSSQKFTEGFGDDEVILVTVTPKRLAFFFARTVEGCEPILIMLGEFEEGVWENTQNCNTVFADFPVIAHLIVVKCLEICQEEGILMDAWDETDFWKSRHNFEAIEILKKAIKEFHIKFGTFAKISRFSAEDEEKDIDELRFQEIVRKVLKESTTTA